MLTSARPSCTCSPSLRAMRICSKRSAVERTFITKRHGPFWVYEGAPSLISRHGHSVRTSISGWSMEEALTESLRELERTFLLYEACLIAYKPDIALRSLSSRPLVT